MLLTYLKGATQDGLFGLNRIEASTTLSSLISKTNTLLRNVHPRKNKDVQDIYIPWSN